MKTVLTIAVLSLSFQAQATEIKSSPAESNIARVVQVIPLVQKQNIRISVAVKDLGGSTDVSPTQKVYFTLYTKGEMFSTDATFDLGEVFEFYSARRISGGVYVVKVSAPDSETTMMPVDKTYIIDARKSVKEIQAVRCEDFDCDASKNFSSTIQLSVK